MNRIAAGIVLFNPEISRLEENISSIIKQSEIIYLVDNGSDNIDYINKLVNQFDEYKIVLQRNKNNEGIAKALNQLCSMAIGDDFKWILTLDQDSVCPSKMVENYSKYINEMSVGMLCPVVLDRNKSDKVEYKDEIAEVKGCITSGSMLSLPAWKKIGGFDENMFIDGVDYDICYRLRLVNYKVVCVRSVVLLHELGHIQCRHFLFWNVIVKNHSAFRKYFIARNIIYVARKRGSILLKAKSILQEIKLLGIVLLYEDDKKYKMVNIVKGIRDGIRGKVGGKS